MIALHVPSTDWLCVCVQEKEESVSQLMAQVDLLRARKKVVDLHIRYVLYIIHASV